MLDIIFSSTVYELGTVFSIGNYISNLESALQKNQNTMPSIFEKGEPRIQTDIEKLIAQFLDN
jgi:hypothetical protein